MRARGILTSAIFTLAAGIATHTSLVSADPEVAAAARSYVENNAQEWLNNPLIARAIIAQNEIHESLAQTDIDAKDQQWRRESVDGNGPLIDQVLSNELSKYLSSVQEDSEGLITEVFIMDNKGLNVGQSDLTSDYWQGDEAKWQKTFLVGPETVFVDDVEMDESTQRYQTQVSYSITDPNSGDVIGAVTIGIDAEGLLML
ncbi:MAG: hypothetical protein KTR32_28295 [Granulosicoccus sp.]|nr:hypothetical protein [Granulosicoccus sp.]